MKLIKASKKFIDKEEDIVILDDITIEFKKRKLYCIVGHSGSGKTTLINILGLIDKIDKGSYILDGKKVEDMTEEEKRNLRKEKIGFIFQDYCLNEYLTAKENVIVPMLLNKNIKRGDRTKKAIEYLTKFNLEKRANHFPKKLSGGEKQRVAIARALVNDPEYLICDEPTGALDRKNEKIVMDHLKELAKSGLCVIVVTHNYDVTKYADITYKLEDGKLKEVKNENN